MKPSLQEAEWLKNVGSANYPVSFLHEYAVGLIWELLHDHEGPVKLPTVDGGLTSDLMDGIDQIIIPDALQAVAGYIPDISLLKNSRPVRCIEVIVTSPVPPEKLAAIGNLGVEIVQVPVRNEEDRLAITQFPSFPSMEGTKRWWFPKFSDRKEPFKSVKERTGVNWRGTRQSKILEAQEHADTAINKLMDNISRCSPELRRAFVAQLNDLSSLGSLYPLNQNNPKHEVVTTS